MKKILAIAFLFVAAANTASACVECVIEKAGYTRRGRLLEVRDGMLEVTVCNEKQSCSAFARNDDGGWRESGTRPVPPRNTTSSALCARIPRLSLAQSEAVELRPHLRVGHEIEMNPVGCVQRDDAIWFGIEFYEGEGMDGVGGIGRYDLEQRRLEIRRPSFLLDKSINDFTVAPNGMLWFGVEQKYEKSGESHGVARFDWARNEFESFQGVENAPCGFQVFDIATTPGKVHVLTDLDVATYDEQSKRWSSVVFNKRGVQTASCRTLHEDLYRAFIANRNSCANCGGNHITHVLGRFRPAFLKSHLLMQNANTWREYEVAFLASRMPDVGHLRRQVINPLSSSAPNLYLDWIIEGFRERGKGDPEWRDFLIELGEVRTLRDFPRDKIAAEYVISRLNTPSTRQDFAAGETLAVILGRDAIPHLIAALTNAGPHGVASGRIVAALEYASHHILLPDGRTIALPPDSDSAEYQENEPYRFRNASQSSGWSRKSIEERERIIARWLRWWETQTKSAAR